MRICDANFGILFRFESEAISHCRDDSAPPACEYASFNRRVSVSTESGHSA